MLAQENELRQRLLDTAARALEMRASARQARQARQAAAETRDQAQTTRERSGELRRVAEELRERALAYAATLHDLGRPAATAIEAARAVADNALRDRCPDVRVDRSERNEIEGELVLWTIDAYLAA